VPRTALSIVSTLGRTGPINVLKGIVRHYDASRYRGVIVTLSPEGPNSQLEEFNDLDVQIIQMNLSRFAGIFKGRSELLKISSETDASIIHCHGFRATRLADCSDFQGRTIASVVSDIDIDYQFAYGPLLGRFMAKVEYSSLRRTKHVISCSISAREALERHGLKSTEILNGIDVTGFKVDAPEIAVARSRAELGWDPRKIIVLHTGILMERKRPLDVIEAFQRSRLAQCGILVFAGNGPLMAQCQSSASASDSIQFLGMRKDIKRLLYGADCLVSASASEGMPMALLEGVASGIQLTISDIAAHRQLHNFFPSRVQLFELANIDKLVQQFDDLAALGKQNREFPSSADLKAISDTEMSASYQRVYDQI
jgi:glycosyltransferase involved in cell wall biosynthesis